MDIDRSTAPGRGVVHHFRPRSGEQFALLTDTNGEKRILVYHTAHDEPAHTIVLGPDEADQFAELLQTSPLPGRVARLERMAEELTGGGNRT